MYRSFARFYPKKLRNDYLNLLTYSGIKVNSDRFIGFVAVFGALLALAITFYMGLFVTLPFWLSFIGIFFLIQIFFYFFLVLRADTKAKFVESILPDVLQLMSSNLRAGLTTDKALLLSARTEFGPFQDEIHQVGKAVTMGKEISSALVDMSKKIKSEMLSKTVALIVSGLKSGGELASLLEQTARNLRREKMVDSRIRANVMTYIIFISVAVCFGSPLLFGLSSFLVEVMAQTLGSIEMPETSLAGALPVTFTSVSISINFVILFSIVFLVTSSILGSLILGLISKGKEREGIRFMPFLVVFSVCIFFLIRFAIKNMLSGFFMV
ncbi:type II secretion system F family protein [Candidatus Woesearchaeota archaeon]|nr:type II secretion system F family protein [Candidatus Woesearchaeota archaeon]